jgi:hypothetical protein
MPMLVSDGPDGSNEPLVPYYRFFRVYAREFEMIVRPVRKPVFWKDFRFLIRRRKLHVESRAGIFRLV